MAKNTYELIMTENQLSELHQKIDQGVKKAITEAIEKHRKLGESIVIWQDGKIVTLTSEQIPKSS
jgi:hypothetical protein